MDRTLWCLWLPIPPFFSCTQHFATFYVSLYDIYTKKTIKEQFLSILGFWHMHKVLKVFFFETFWAIVYFINTWCEYKYKLAFALAIIQSRRSGCAIVLFLATRYFPCRIRKLSVLIYRQNSLNIHFKRIICMFSSKQKNVELNLLFISQANNIGNSEIPASLSRDRYFALRYLSYTVSFIGSRGCLETWWPGMSRMCWSFFIGIVVWITRMCWNFFIGIVYGW